MVCSGGDGGSGGSGSGGFSTGNFNTGGGSGSGNSGFSSGSGGSSGGFSGNSLEDSYRPGGKYKQKKPDPPSRNYGLPTAALCSTVEQDVCKPKQVQKCQQVKREFI